MNEDHNLETHVAACSERYKTIFNRLTRIERILLGVAAMLILGLLALLEKAINWQSIFPH